MMKALLVLVGFAAGAFVTYTFTQVQEARAAANRVYELRTYHTLPGRLPALEKRFREHTTKIFEKHGMKNVGYWVPQDAPASENTLIYVLSYDSREAAKKAWQDFRNDPEWKAAQKASEADGKIVEKVESVYMSPTDYSPVK
jgi:hypothetical protein